MKTFEQILENTETGDLIDIRLDLIDWYKKNESKLKNDEIKTYKNILKGFDELLKNLI